MPSVSTHVLNSENGTHVSGLTVTLTHVQSDGIRKIIFSNKTDTGGRLVENFDFPLINEEFFEIEFKLSDIHIKKKVYTVVTLSSGCLSVQKMKNFIFQSSCLRMVHLVGGREHNNEHSK